MTQNEPQADKRPARAERDRIAREQGHESYADAPGVVQNVIDSVVEGATIKEPFAMFERDR